MGKKVKVLLMEYVQGLGERYDIVDVASSFAKNVLIPQGKAKLADKQVLNNMEVLMEKRKKEKEKQMEGLNNMIETFEKDGIVLEKNATDNGGLYEKIDAKNIANMILMEHKIKVPKEAIIIENVIDKIGDYEFGFDFEGIKKTIKMSIKPKSS